MSTFFHPIHSFQLCVSTVLVSTATNHPSLTKQENHLSSENLQKIPSIPPLPTRQTIAQRYSPPVTQSENTPNMPALTNYTTDFSNESLSWRLADGFGLWAGSAHADSDWSERLWLRPLVSNHWPTIPSAPAVLVLCILRATDLLA
jgi:hypothetical protein